MIAALIRCIDALSGFIGLEPKKGRFLAVGGVNTVFGIGIYPLFLWLLDDVAYGYLIALALAQVVSLMFAYTTHKLIVFRTVGGILAEFARFSSFYVSGYAINWVALPVLVELFRLDPMLAQIGFTIVMIVLSYFWHNHVTFRARGDENSLSEQ